MSNGIRNMRNRLSASNKELSKIFLMESADFVKAKGFRKMTKKEIADARKAGSWIMDLGGPGTKYQFDKDVSVKILEDIFGLPSDDKYESWFFVHSSRQVVMVQTYGVDGSDKFEAKKFFDFIEAWRAGVGG